MPAWSELLGQGGQIGETLLVWGVLNQIIGDLLGPMEELIRQQVNSAHPEVANSPADLADMLVRGVLDKANAEHEARLSGINAERFDRLRLLAGEPIGLEQILEAYRRGFIGWEDTGQETPSAERAIKTARYYNYWAPIIKQLAEIPIPVGAAVDAALRGQVPLDRAKAEAYANGITEDRFQILLDSAGNPPSPGELLELLRRGLIPLEGVGAGVISFQQGIFEGDAKDKWWKLYAALAEYKPPPRIVTTLLRNGAIDTATASALFQDAGLSPTMAAAYVKSVKGEKLAGTKQIAESTVLTLFDEQAISANDATTHLAALGYDTADIALLLEITELQREQRALNAAVNRIGTLYVAHKITRDYAKRALDELAVTPGHAEHFLATWDITAAANVRPLTPAQIVDAWEIGIIDQDEAQTELVNIGYTPRDAWILLSIKAKAAQPNPPAQGPSGPGINP